MAQNRNKRDIAITLTCQWCGTTYHPWRQDRGKNSNFCSRLCRSRGVMAKVNNGAFETPIPMPKRTAKSEPATTANKVGKDWKESGEHWERVFSWILDRQLSERKRISQKDSTYSTVGHEGRSITLSGYGARLHVSNDHLLISQGRDFSTQQIQSETLYRGIHGVSSILWLTNGGAGTFSVAALKWCASQNITVRLLTNRGEHLATIHPSPDAPQALGIPNQENGRADIKLRRAQYALAPTRKDIPLARTIILRKLEAQLKCLNAHPELPDRDRGFAALDVGIEWLSLEKPTPTTSTLDGIRLYEARAGKGYFIAWRGLPLLIDDKANKEWSPIWKTVAERNSPLTRWMSAQNATNPAQSILNFCYAMLESQVRAALYAIGADVACGILHGDKYNRDSLVFDIMEPLRGEVDNLVLEFFKIHVFSAADFNTSVTGAITIHPTLCKVLAEVCRLPQRKSDDEARWFRDLVLGKS